MTPFTLFSHAFSLNAETGVLTWKITNRKGKPAGIINIEGYVIITWKGKRYRAHRIVWLLHTGKWPELEIDHWDRCNSNNKPSNLRDVTHAVNLSNILPRKCASSNHPGVYQRPSGNWSVMKRRKSYGTYSTKEQAIAIYNNLK